MTDLPELTTPQPWEPVLDFWFGDALERGWPAESRNRLWFRASAAVDAEIGERFGHAVELALRNELVEWEGVARRRLALILLLDQFTRNIYRSTAAAYAGDHRAQTLVLEALALGMDRELSWIGRVFFYMPLMHAEDPDLQEQGVDAYRRLQEQAPGDIASEVEYNLEFAREHRDIIERFGRFPHRNRVLGRENTPEEESFLESASSYGQ